MKEVKLFQFRDFVRDNTIYKGGWTDNKRGREEVEQNLAAWLSAGWQIEGTGGEYLAQAFVILVRERQE